MHLSEHILTSHTQNKNVFLHMLSVMGMQFRKSCILLVLLAYAIPKVMHTVGIAVCSM